MKNRIFKKISGSLQYKIEDFEKVRKERIKKKIEGIGDNIYQLLGYNQKSKFDIENIKELSNDIDFQNIPRDFINKTIGKNIISILVKLDDINIGYISYILKGENEVYLSRIITSNFNINDFELPNKLIEEIEKLHNQKLDQEDIEFIKEQYISKLNQENFSILNQFSLELTDIEEPYIGSSILYNFFNNLKIQNIKNISFQATVTSLQFYIKILDLFKQEKIISSYDYTDNFDPLLKDFQIKL